MINLFRSRPNLCYDAVVETLSTLFRDSVAKQQELAHMLMGVICAEVADCDVVDR